MTNFDSCFKTSFLSFADLFNGKKPLRSCPLKDKPLG